MLTGIDYLIWQLWPYLLLALLLGLGWGWYSCARSADVEDWRGREVADGRRPMAGSSGSVRRG
jgi:hypothetical protein